MPNINTRPGIQWDKEDIVFRTASGKVYIPQNYTLSKRSITADREWINECFYLTKQHDYLSIQSFKLRRKLTAEAFKSNKKYQAYLDENKVTPRLIPTKAALECDTDAVDNELRIYRDGRVALIHHYVINGEDKYFVARGKNNRFDPFSNYQCNYDIDIEVKSNKAIKNLASKLQKSELKAIHCCVAHTNDIRGRDMKKESYINPSAFSKTTQNIVNSFFDVKKAIAENDMLIPMMAARRYAITDRLSTIPELLAFVNCLQTNPRAMRTKQEKIEYAKSLAAGVNLSINEGDRRYGHAVWGRKGDEIYYLCGSSRYDRKLRISAVIFNLKTHKKYFVKENYYGHIVGTPTIHNIVQFGGFEDNMIIEFMKGQTFDDVFAGTLLSGIKKEDLDTNHQQSYLGLFALEVLVADGNLFVEQLWKSGCKNLFYAYIDSLSFSNDKFVASNSTSAQIIRQIVAGENKPHPFIYEVRRPCLIYNPKGKSLKEMTGLSIDYIRIIDKYTSGDESPTIIGLEEAIGCPVNRLDKETFEECVKHSQHFNWSSYLDSKREIFKLCDDSIKKELPGPLNPGHASAKQVIAFTEHASIHHSLYYLREYYFLRKQAQEIQARHPELELFDEETYPKVPGTVVKFLPVREYGWIYRTGYERDGHVEQDPIIESVNRKMIVMNKLYLTDKNFVDEVYKDGKFEGYKIKMDLCSHAKFLHDKLQNWIGLFQDETNSIKFSEAVKRVRSLAWKDKETGLEIRVPNSIKDLQNEGKVLGHCVAGYAQSMAEQSSFILFVRRSDCPKIPFCTIEVAKGAIKQDRIYRNNDTTPFGQSAARKQDNPEHGKIYEGSWDIKGFLNKWKRKVLDKHTELW